MAATPIETIIESSQRFLDLAPSASYAGWHELNKIDRNRISVPSSDGTKRYIVRYAGMADGDENTRLWKCNCPAGRFGRGCRHVKAAIDAVQYMDYALDQ